MSRHRALQKGGSLLRTKSRDNVGTVSTAGQQLLIGQGESMLFVGFWSCSITKSCPTLFEPLPGSSVHGILQVRILEWIANSFSRGSSPPRGGTCISCIGRWILYHWATRESQEYKWGKFKDTNEESFKPQFDSRAKDLSILADSQYGILSDYSNLLWPT